jgi:hypothetical protein
VSMVGRIATMPAVRCRRRTLYALVAAALVLLAATLPAHTPEGGGRAVRSDTPHVADVAASVANLSAAVAQRLPVPNVWPMQQPAPVPALTLVLLAWILMVGAVLTGRPVGSTRRERAPPVIGRLLAA